MAHGETEPGTPRSPERDAHGPRTTCAASPAPEECTSTVPSAEVQVLPPPVHLHSERPTDQPPQRTLSCEQLLRYSSDVARLLTDDEDDEDDDTDARDDDADADADARDGSAEESEEEEEVPIVSRAAAIRMPVQLGAEIPLAAFSSHLYARPSERPAASRDSFLRPTSSARSPGKVAAGGGAAGARILGMASPPVSISSQSPSVPAGAATAAAPATKKIVKAPKTRTCSFELQRSKAGPPEKTDSTAPLEEVENAGSEGVESEEDIWSPEQVMAREADLRFRVGGSLYLCVKKCLERNGFQPCTSGEADWNIFWGRPLRPNEFGELDQFQKVNHFPGTSVLGRKDQLARACQRARRLWGAEEMDFLPKTWVLPSDRSELATDVEDKDTKTMYIVKPPDGCKGQGIRIYNDPIAHTKASLACVVSRYIGDPLLINGAKFDMRIYVTVTCFQPLRVYVHEQGLVRLCTAAYNASSKMSSRKNKYSHLTNYAVNRDNVNFVVNTSAEDDNRGHKWSLRALRDWMRQQEIDPEPIFHDIDKLIVKTLIAVEAPVNSNVSLCTPNRNSCFELLGFDVMIDSACKPWLLEVNTSPSLACDTPLDAAIKSQVMVPHLPSG